MTTNIKMNVYHPDVVAAMKKRGLVPVKQVEERKQWNGIHKSIAEMGAKVKREAEHPQGKVGKIIILNERPLDFGQTPHGQKPKPLFKGNK